jgi:hypothetical protein
MGQTQIEVVGNVFTVIGGKRKCLICDGAFTLRQAAEHAATVRYPPNRESEQGAAYTDRCSPFLLMIASSSSQGQA